MAHLHCGYPNILCLSSYLALLTNITYKFISYSNLQSSPTQTTEICSVCMQFAQVLIELFFLFILLGPNVCIENENSIVSFGNIECGKASTGLVHLKNRSAVAAVFQVICFMHIIQYFKHSNFILQLQIRESSVFCCDVVSGQLAPKTSTSVSVKFIPHRPIPYCRMVSVLIQNQVLLAYFFSLSCTECYVTMWDCMCA